MKQYIKPEIEIELIETGNELLEDSYDNTGGNPDSFSKHGNYGSFDFSDDDEDDLFYKKYTVKW